MGMFIHKYLWFVKQLTVSVLDINFTGELI